MQNCDGGWIAGQHIRLRIFFSGRIFESHPLTILNAPAPLSSISSGELILATRVSGDWTRAVNALARQEEKTCRVNVMTDGPYGGPTIDIGEYESVLLVAGGSGATFTIGLLDDIVGRIINMKRKNGEKTTRIEFVWCIKSFGMFSFCVALNLSSRLTSLGSISWFSPMLLDIANKAQGSSLDLHFQIFVTCLCDPEAVTVIPNCEVKVEKPKVAHLLEQFIAPRADVEAGNRRGDGGVAVAVSGPESLTAEAQNVIAQIPIAHTRRLGGLALHTEIFSL